MKKRKKRRKKKQGNDLHCGITLHHRLSSSFPGVPLPAEASVAGIRRAGGKQTAQNQGQLQASTISPWRLRTVRVHLV